MAEARPTRFAPTVVLGLATAALSSVASAKPWFRLADSRPTAGVPVSETRVDMPLALALSLVVLAGWGAILVSRGVMRRLCAAIGLAAALGVVACAMTAPFVLPDDLRSALDLSVAHAGVRPTGWYVTTAVVSVVAAATLAAAWRLAPRWPTMSSRYDAPGTVTAPRDQTDLWKALDEGHDPTESAGPTSP